MANEKNLQPGDINHKLTPEEQQKGGIKSGQVRKERATMKKAIEWLLNSDIKITKGSMYDYYQKQGLDISKLSTTQLATLGLWQGALQGNATNFKTLMEANNEIVEESTSTPTIKIEINDNSNLEGVMYEANKSDKNDEGK